MGRKTRHRLESLRKQEPPSVRMATIPTERAVEPCGTCTACCTAMGVAEIGKPCNEPCQELVQIGLSGPEDAPGGCRIYDRRPGSCRAFACAWKIGMSGSGAVEDRPDHLGIIIDFAPDTAFGPVLMVHECWPGALEGERARQIVAHTAWIMDLTRAIVMSPGDDDEVRRVIRIPQRPLPPEQLSDAGRTYLRISTTHYEALTRWKAEAAKIRRP